MSVSVVIPAFNAEKYLAETLDSIAHQTVKPFEVLVCDDYSADGTSNLVQKLSKTFPVPLRLISNYRNKGIGYTRQQLAHYAQGDYVAYLSSDDCYLPTFIEKSLPFLDENTASYTMSFYCNKNLKPQWTFTPPEYSRESVIDWALKKNMYVNFSSIIVPKRIFETVNFVEELHHGEDLIFLLDTVIAELNWHLVKEPLLHYRVHSKQGSFTQKLEEFEMFWRFLQDRLKKLNVDESVIEACYARSKRVAFPPLHRRLAAKAYHKIFGLKKRSRL